MPATTERQRRFMGAELARKRAGKKTRTGMSEAKLKEFAAKPHHVATGSMHEIVQIDEGAMFGDKVVAPCGSEEHSGSTPALEASKSKRMNRPLGYGSDDEHRNSPLEETFEHMLENTGR